MAGSALFGVVLLIAAAVARGKAQLIFAVVFLLIAISTFVLRATLYSTFECGEVLPT